MGNFVFPLMFCGITGRIRACESHHSIYLHLFNSMSSPTYDRPPYALYNPGMLPPETLLSEFTARKGLLKKLLEIVRRNQEGEPQQHVIAIGPRGMGKTTLLWAIAASIQLREPDLNAAWQPVPFDEESRRVGDMADFWMECIRQWETATEPDRVHSAILDQLLDYKGDGDELEELAKKEFLKLVDASGKRALLLIDNLNELFAAIHDPEPLRRLRSFLMSDSRVMIVGAATQYFEAIRGLDKPFFEFFREFELKALNLEETMDCLEGLAEVRGDEPVKKTLKDRPKGVEALHVLTGGNPRLVRTFYRLLSEGMTDDLQQQLERLLDDYTPYQKSMIDVLSVQQQRIFDAIALQWNPCEVAVVARETRLKSNQVSAQIKALVKSGMISEVPGAGNQKKKAYMLTDRFSNIHYLMRHGRTGRLRMHWYVMTLRALFDDDAYVESAFAFVKSSNGGGQIADFVNLASSAISCAGTDGARRALWDRFAGSIEHDEEVVLDNAEKLLQQQLEKTPEDAYIWFKWGRFLNVHLKQLKGAETAYRKSIELNPDCWMTWNNLGVLVRDLGRMEEAEGAFRKSLEIDSESALVWNNLGNLLNDTGRTQEAEVTYRKILELEPGDSMAWSNLGNLLSDTLRKEEAEIAYRKAIALEQYDSRMRFNLGVLLVEMGRKEEAEMTYRKVLELDPDDSMAWNNLGNLLNDTGRGQEAEAAYRKVLELDPNDSSGWNNLGALLKGTGRDEEAETAYRKSLEFDPLIPNPRSGLAHLLFSQGQKREESVAQAVAALKCKPLPYSCWVFMKIGADKNKKAVADILPVLSHWCSEHRDDSESLTFTVDLWIQFVRITNSREVLELFESDEMSDESRLPFKIIEDAIRAVDDKEHLHRLAPERLAPVLKYLEKLEEPLELNDE